MGNICGCGTQKKRKPGKVRLTTVSTSDIYQAYDFIKVIGNSTSFF